ncbi:protein BREAKING OF ASYMMETRY IN THE STOMATAL LINEAGE [Momordica charantia]|uniref:Protein BREAKING OF ASYMMETRY IN THE STOMATAL LINEAGE n=1 Tax=Momordica charantia TaxID=3673 RepID=A0A6J1C9E8_MOMCH|nr:protein BREAKING OF ASYMMETRY IN THE STOMATAL LINEAGE [Momordica charantia]XP_022137114.1 protein BREAKING OF ASYMMETRY IN THE STOMATAL LINEAGE [Momordica charantia]XP_022137115.1 protein BREAKING OF ASYMMETRY IN THE STOMATAL LINEAGE [Momordica charantia]XP_022137116.1 protein BREAKING OF ASYMMETRY IN THE STOMATAL LINEAGE [Momordica charantia]
MSTPWTMTRLVRWQVRDWASCFLACRFPLDDEPDRYFTSTPPPVPIRTMVVDRKSIASRGKEDSKKMSRQRKGEKGENKRQEKRFSPQTSDAAVENKMTDNPNWLQFEDENYIVFCFNDGAFDVTKNGNSEASNRIDLVAARSRPVSRKLDYGKDDKSVKRSSSEKKLNGGPPQKDEEEQVDKESAMGESEAICDCRIVAVSTESSDSNHSDVSNGSFAFPVLGLEWSGSPVQMPKSEGLQLRKHKSRCVGFQCCKF